MSAQSTAADAPRHPWLRVFDAAPVQAFDALLKGSAAVFPYTRADPPDAARMLFAALPGDDPARLALDEAALKWLREQRREPIPADLHVRQDVIRQISEAFEIVALLQLPQAALALRREYIRWNEWTSQLVLDSSRDARGDYLRMLAQTQMLLQPELRQSDSLASLWFRLCREAGISFPETYLQIGLLGLRRLPEATGRGDMPWIVGVAEWALATRPTEARFQRVWRPLRRLYPANPTRVRRAVYTALDRKPFRDAGFEPPAWWSCDLEINRPAAQKPQRLFEPPSPDTREAILEEMKNGQPFSSFKARFDQLTRDHKRYAERSGDGYFLVRTFCNIGRRLIDNMSESRHERSAYAQELARDALGYEPNNPIAWSLWRDALAAGGDFAAAIGVGWELVRRFPQNPFMRSQLAEILLASKDIDTAKQVLTSAIDDNAVDAVSYAIRARIAANEGDMPTATKLAADGLRIDPDNAVLFAIQNLVANAQAPELVSITYRDMSQRWPSSETFDPMLEAIISDGELRALRGQMDVDGTARAKVVEMYRQNPANIYAQILVTRYGLLQTSCDDLPSVAAAFEAALSSEDLVRLDALARIAPRLRSLILLARAIFGDEAAAETIARMLQDQSVAEADNVISILRARLRPVISRVEDGASPAQAIQAEKKLVCRVIYDANEVLAAPEMIAA